MIINFKGSQRLKQEIQAWVDEAIISPEQAARLYQKYGLQGEPPWYLRSGFILKALALLLAGMGLLLIISENWHRFNIPIRMAFGLTPLFAAYLIGFRYLFAEKRGQAELAFFFASIAFGINIFLQAQIFHISAYYPDGFLWWIIGALPVAIYFRSSLHHALLQLLFFIWMTQQIEYNHFSYWAPLLFAGMLWLLYKTAGKIIFLTAMANTYLFTVNVNAALMGQTTGASWMLLSAVTLLLIVLLPLVKEQYDEKFLDRIKQAGIWLIVFTFYLHTFADVAFFYSGNSVSILALVIFMAASYRVFKSERSTVITASFSLTAVIGALHVIGAFYQGEKALFANTAIIFTNPVFFGYALWQISLGIRNKVKRLFMTGIILVVIQAVSRYLDLFENYILTSVIFILSGLFVYLMNTYWNKRYET